MTFEEIEKDQAADTYTRDWRYRGVFIGRCDSCGREFKVLTQEDKSPEYHTDIWIEHCPGRYVPFTLPVN